METTKRPATEVRYSAIDRSVTIRFADDHCVRMSLNDAFRLGQQLTGLFRPMELRVWAD